jgi:hypothetical protein
MVSAVFMPLLVILIEAACSLFFYRGTRSASGTGVIHAMIIGGPYDGSKVIFVRNWGGALTKLVARGDLDPGTGRAFGTLSLISTTASPINDAGQVAFTATLQGSPAKNGIFMIPIGSTPMKVALTGDPAPGGGTFQSFTPIGLNQAGQVVFLAAVQSGSSQFNGIFVGAPGSAPVKIAMVGDPAPGGGTFSGFANPAFNNLGEVAFMATLTGGPGGGVFAGSTTGPLVALALNGNAAPSGGNFSISSARANVLINDRHDVVFRADLSGGSADSGYFMRRGALGALKALVLQGQPAPGTSGTFSTISGATNTFLGTYFALGQAGDIVIQQPFSQGGALPKTGYWHVKPDDNVEEILINGQTLTQLGGGTVVLSYQGRAVSGTGGYAFMVRASGAPFTDAIVLFVPQR